MKIAITGANGQLGKCFQGLSPQYPDWTFVWADARTVDITNKEEIDAFFQKNKVDVCINCAAYTAVDKAESEPEQAYKVNVSGAKNLAEACNTYHTLLIHFSTDYVYHSAENRPIKEDAPVNPQGIYAQTKLDGDRAVLDASPENMVIRTSWVYAPDGHNFVKTILRLANERDQINVVFDQVGTPTYAPDLANAVLNILKGVENRLFSRADLGGVWHYSNEGVISWYDFARQIVELSGSTCNVLPIESVAYPTPAPRPPYSVLNKQKIKSAFGIQIPYWRDSLKACLRQL